jgi:hypothetical protein
MGCVAQSADVTPRVFTGTSAMLSQHNYCPAIDFCSMFFNETRLPVVFIGLPIATAGAISRQNGTGVTGTSVITISASSSAGPMEETQAGLTVVNGGTIGTAGISFNLSLDGGFTNQLVQLGTATSYAIPYVNITINFAAGTLVANDVYSWVTTAPIWDGPTGITPARLALAAQQSITRSWLPVGDCPDVTHANAVLNELNNYETANQRFVFGRVQVLDRVPLASKSKTSVSMTGNPSVTFAATGHTITRATGSFISDGFQNGMVVTAAGTTANNGVLGAVSTVTATVLTFASGIVNEGPEGNVTLTASEGITFAASGFTVTRSGAGSWLADGFAIGDSVTITGTASNNTTQTVSNVTATVLTFGGGIVNEGPSRSDGITMTKGQTLAGWASAITSTFASIDGQRRIDIGAGRGRKVSPITGWNLRRPVQWAATLREYQHDVQIPCWRKKDGPLNGWSLVDLNNNVVEYDERVVGGLLAARFTCFRSYGNGPNGAFIALSLTRDTDGSLLSRTHNMAVADVGEQTVQTETENAIGEVLILKSDGTGTDASLALIEQRVNSALQVNLLQPGAEGPRTSKAVWSAARTDILNIAGAQLIGSLLINLNGTLEKILTRVRVQTAGS